MSADNYILSVLNGSRRDFAATVLRGILAALAYIYSVGLKLYLLPYRLGIRRQARLSCPVISIGNLTVGGTGKTPMTIRICRQLTARGLRVCVLNRGYKGANEFGAKIVSNDRIEISASEAGDEAYLLATQLKGVPVIVGKDRRRTGALAIERFRPDVIVLDDGMQFYQLYRDLDIVLLDSRRPFDNGWTFPRGLLREPPSHLRRAGCVVITNTDKVQPDSIESLTKRIEELAPRKPVLTARMAPVKLRALDNLSELDVEWLSHRRVALLSAIGSPESFAAQLRNAGAIVTHHSAFPDHHEVTGGELQEIVDEACRTKAEAIIVTEKDAVKLPPMMRPLPFYALSVEMVFDDIYRFESILLNAARPQ